MDWKTILHKGILRGGICILLSAAMILGLVLPGTNMKPAQPEDPLENESIREISVLKVGENINELQTIVVPNGGSAAPTEPNEESEQTDPEETKPNETVPKETESEEPDVDEGEEGNEDGNQGEDGGEELDLNLAAVMTWYRYGNEPKTITCSPGKAVAKTLNTAQLKNNELKYQFALTGVDARYVEITSVSLAEGDSAYRQVKEDGSVDIQLPGGNGDRKYTFQVTALAEKENDAGETVEQEILFFFVLKCEFAMDLEMELTWTEQTGRDHVVRCGPDKAEAFTVQSYELKERIFYYTTNLTGALADNAEIVEATYTTASGIRSGALEVGSGSLILDPEPGTNTDTYYLTFTVKTAERTVLYTYNLVYQEMLDVQLSFTWQEKGMIDHTLTCQPEGSASERVKNNQLSAGAIPFEMQLIGADSEDGGTITSILYTSEAGGGELEAVDVLPMTMPEGGTSNTYRITVNALVKGQRMSFTIILYYANDVTLQMEYVVRENGSNQPRFVSCENTKSRTAEAVCDDQLTDGLLEYNMTIAGSDAENVRITRISCFQSGSGNSLSLSEVGDVQLLLNNGKTGENTFTVQAQDDGGNEYYFTINIPYKHRGENNIKIETNLENGQEIINGTKTNLSVKAWSEDASGNVVDYIPANGVDTKLIVKLDETEISYISSSGASSEYDLVPENPEVGDTNEHILYIYAEDAYGNFGELTLTLMGQRREAGQKIGTAKIYVDMTVLGLGVVDSISYEVLAEEPISYVIAKALLCEDTGDPFGAAADNFGWSGRYEGTLDIGFYLASLTTGHSANALEDSSWPGSTEEEVLEAIDDRFGAGTGLATLWRCLYRNGLNKSSGSGGSFGEFDYTSGSGWMYSVGGTTYYPGQSMSAVYLQDGDSLTVRYTLAQGWDVGGGSPGYGSTVGYCVSAVNGSFHISHRMETITGANGTEINMCHCCGIIQDCAHKNMTYLDLEDGTHIQYCDDCKTPMGDAAAHTWDANPEADVHTCTVCGHADEHIWKLNKETDNASCEEPGEGTYRCIDCETTKVDQTPPKGHAYDNTWYFTEDLHKHYQICSNCEQVVSEENHIFAYDAAEEDNICITCGLPHDFATGYGHAIKSVIGGTCERIEYVCECGNTLTKVGEPGEFADYHPFDGREYCPLCDAENPNYDPDNPDTPDDEEHTHQFGAWYVTIEPTAEEVGEETRDCECGYSETREVKHVCSYTSGEIIEEPTCADSGYLMMVCSCGNEYEKEIPPTGDHVPEDSGEDCVYIYYVCAICEKNWREPLPEDNHDWGEDGTCTECGAYQPQSLFYLDNLSNNRKRRNNI